MCKVYFIYVTKKICYFMFYMEQTMPTKRCRLCTNRDAVFEMWKITLLDYHLFKRDIFTASVSWQSPIRIRSPWFPKITRIWEREVVSLETKKKKKKSWLSGMFIKSFIHHLDLAVLSCSSVHHCYPVSYIKHKQKIEVFYLSHKTLDCPNPQDLFSPTYNNNKGK